MPRNIIRIPLSRSSVSSVSSLHTYRCVCVWFSLIGNSSHRVSQGERFVQTIGSIESEFNVHSSLIASFLTGTSSCHFFVIKSSFYQPKLFSLLSFHNNIERKTENNKNIYYIRGKKKKKTLKKINVCDLLPHHFPNKKSCFFPPLNTTAMSQQLQFLFIKEQRYFFSFIVWWNIHQYVCFYHAQYNIDKQSSRPPLFFFSREVNKTKKHARLSCYQETGKYEV